MNKKIFESISAYHPGYYLINIIDEMEITQDEFARRLSVTPKNLSDLLNGKASISDTIAKNLSLMLGTSVDVWLNLQQTYDEMIIEIEKLETQRKEESDLDLIDYSFFVKLGLVKQTRDRLEKVTELFKYLCVSSFSVLKQPQFLVQFRHGASVAIDEKLILNSNAWVQTIINKGKEIETQPFDEKKLMGYLPVIRAMTNQKPEVFYPELKEKLAECGVALVVIPSLKNSGIYGAIKWVNHNKVILGITARGRYADIFWFSFFHELGHVFQKKITKIIVDSKETELNKDLETNANDFARETLIPQTEFSRFILTGNFTFSSVEQFAKPIGIHPGVVVGRLQKEELIPHTHLNNLREKYIIS